MTQALWAAVATGLVGSLHCAAMCGPLALSGCGNLSQGVGYLSGRLLSYALMGALMGSLGEHALCRLPMDVVGDAAVVLVAVAALARGVSLLRDRASRPSLVQLGGAKRRGGMAFIASLLPRRGLGLGLVTGILPCGMLVAAWLLAASAGNALGGAAVMVAFSLASAPGLMAPVLGRFAVGARLRPRLQGAAWLLLSLVLALRPLYATMHHHH